MRSIIAPFSGIAALACLSILVFACASPERSDSSNPAVDQQVAHGAEVYGMSCARCHGDAGQGTRKAPPLVGSGALPLHAPEGRGRSRPFHTALDIALFVTESMPPAEDQRAELAADDYWAVLAFALTANGVALSDPVTPDNAAGLVLHP